jgi:phenylalanine-4-hydroxylase
VPTAGFVPARAFFGALARRRFPTVVTIRPADRLDYLPEPDVFHDVFGHVPLHSDPVFARLLADFGRLALRIRGEAEMTALARLFWFTVEFGLVNEGSIPKIYGSGLVSSAADGAHGLGPECERRPFVLEAVLRQPFAIDRLQDLLFVIESFEELEEALPEAARLLA